jgi:hypothetical protein
MDRSPAAPAGLIREMPVEQAVNAADKRQRVAAVLAETMLIIWRCAAG